MNLFLFFHQVIDRSHAVDLNSLSSFFELFAGFNLVYSIVEAFRVILNDEVLDVNRALREARKKRIEARHKVRLSMSSGISEQHEELMLRSLKSLDNIVRLYKCEKVSRKYPDGFKSAFLMSGAFSLSVILINGFSSFFETDDGSVRRVLGIFTVFVLVYNLIVFFRSFHPIKLSCNIKPFITILYLVVCIVFSYLYVEKLRTRPGSEIWNLPVVMMAVFTSSSAFLLHFLRAFVHKFVSRYRAKGYMMELDDCAYEIGYLHSRLKLKIGEPGRIHSIFEKIKYCLSARG